MSLVVVAKTVIMAGATVGAAALCAIPPGVGCVAGAGLIAAAASYGTQAVDNVWEASGGTTLFDSQYYNADTLYHNIDWRQVGVDGVVGAVGAGFGGAGALTKLCKGAACRVGVDMALGFVEGVGTQMIVNVLDGDDCTKLFDGALREGMWGAAFAGASSIGGEIVGRFKKGGVDADVPCSIERNSFTGETLVVTDEGAVPISEIEIGDKVLAYNEELGTTDYYTVTAVWSHEGESLAYVTIDGETIEATLQHPFYTEEYGWLYAEDLWLGMHVQSADTSYGEIESLQLVPADDTVYNLTVAGAHTFFVGDGEWLVHNTGPCDLIRAVPEDQVGTSQPFKRRSDDDGLSVFEGVSPEEVLAEMPGIKVPNTTVTFQAKDLPKGTQIIPTPSKKLSQKLSDAHRILIKPEGWSDRRFAKSLKTLVGWD